MCIRDSEKLSLTEDKLTEDALTVFHQMYEAKEEEIGKDRMREVERMILLRVVDNHWIDVYKRQIWTHQRHIYRDRGKKQIYIYP